MSLLDQLINPWDPTAQGSSNNALFGTPPSTIGGGAGSTTFGSGLYGAGTAPNYGSGPANPPGFDPNNPLNQYGASLVGNVPDQSGAYGTPTSPLPGSDLAGLWDLLQAANAPSMAAAQQNIAALQGQLPLIGAQYQVGVDTANQGAAYQLGQLGLSEQQLALQKQMQQLQAGQLPQQEALQQQLFGYNRQDIQAQLDAAKRMYPQQVQAFQGGQAAKGATFTGATQQGLGNLQFQYQQTLDRLNRASGREGVSEQQHALQYQQQQLASENAGKNLDILSKKYGLQGQYIQQSLQNTINQLGLNQLISTQQVYQAIAQAQQGEFSPLSSMVDTIIQASAMSGQPLPISGQGISASIGQLPASAPKNGNSAVSIAQQFIGTPYSYGGDGNGPGQPLDCSRLVQDVYSKLGINLPRTTYQQINYGTPVPYSAAQPGDLLFFGTASDPHHVGIYIGNGQMIDAPHSGADVRQEAVWTDQLVGVRRVL